MRCPGFVCCPAGRGGRGDVREDRNDTLQVVWPGKVRLSFPRLRPGRISGNDASALRPLEPGLGKTGRTPAGKSLEDHPCGSGGKVKTRSEDQENDVCRETLSLSAQNGNHGNGNPLLGGGHYHEKTGRMIFAAEWAFVCLVRVRVRARIGTGVGISKHKNSGVRHWRSRANTQQWEGKRIISFPSLAASPFRHKGM